VDGIKGLQNEDRELLHLFEEKKIPYVIALNKADLLAEDVSDPEEEHSIWVSAQTGQNIYELKERIGHLVKQEENSKRIVADLLEPEDVVVLVVPIDSAAPKGRLILPQQQTIRDALEAGASVVVTRESELISTLEALKKKPRLVITDSQAFGVVSKNTPEDIPLTSFSILFVRYKGDLPSAIRGAAQLAKLKDGDKVLIAEGCTHHRQCDDIGTVKMPGWITNYSGAKLEFEFSSGMGFPEDLSEYALIVHCGGCMLNEREMQYRTRQAQDAGIPMTNYGIAIAQMHGILRRSLDPFPELKSLLD
jgi:[FeFe] hydrogenase H-cluster maturation GTPase HydF